MEGVLPNLNKAGMIRLPLFRVQGAWQLHSSKALLEQPEDFENDHDNDNHSNYVKDVSAHTGDSY
jgi:hypothetical protein